MRFVFGGGLAALFASVTVPALAQERTANNAVYVEGGGPALLYSVNYERTISDFALRVGAGYLSLKASDPEVSARVTLLTVPIGLNFIGIGSKTHIFELGAGATVAYIGGAASLLNVESKEGSATSVLGYANAGYRLQPAHGGFMLRLGVSPILSKEGVLPLGYLSLGGVF